MGREESRLIYSWLFLAVFALVFAGVFAFLAAMTRTPAVKLLASASYFRVSIVAHVIFSLVVWFLAFMAALWAYEVHVSGRTITPKWNAGLWVAAAGMTLIALASILGLGEPLLIDYVPLLDHPVYLAGLFLLALGISITIVGYASSLTKAELAKLNSVSYGMLAVGAITLIAFLSVFLSASSLLYSNSEAVFLGYKLHLGTAASILSSNYKTLFWGPGHIIQFANTLAMIVVWFVLLETSIQNAVNQGIAKKMISTCLGVALGLPLIYLLPPQNQARFFTLGMIYGLGIPSAILATLVLKTILDYTKSAGFKGLPWNNPAFSSIVLSLALFGVGGAIGVPGLGSNLRVPAHYHGSLGAVTMAFMGMSYLLLRLLDIAVFSERIARIQPYLYGLGLLVIILGLFWAGAYNAPRKAFGYDDPLTALAMNLMGGGAIIAVLGGAAFVANTLLSLLKGRNKLSM